MKWELNKQYKKGDIARVVSNFYICIKQHVSDNLMRPSKDDMYWMHLSKPIINNIKKNVMKTSGDSEFVNNKMVMDDDESDYDSEEDINAIKDAMMTGLENAFKKQGIPMLNLIIPTQQKETIQIPKKTNSKVNNELKRKLAEEENKIVSYKKSRTGLPDSEYKNRILLLDVDIKTKTYILDKYENIKKMGSSDYSKGMAWLNTVLNIPFGKCKDFINNNDTKLYMKQVKEVLDKHVHGLEDVKQEILEFVARKVTNPNGKGHVLALHGVKGTGKTKIARALAEALQLPFNQINFGGMNDAAILNGHSETYVGSKPGKLVDIMIDSGVMNGIIMMDEVDKISESKNKEINGILTHLLDEEQNKEFQDNYIGQVPIDLSKVLFVITFNDIDKVDHIVSDRMKIINITSPSIDDKLIIARDKMIPEICNKTICFDKKYKFIIEDNVIYDIIKNRTYGEIGVRKLKKALEEIFNKVNYYLIADESKLHINTISTDEIYVNITRSFVNNILQNNNQEDQSYMSMYI